MKKILVTGAAGFIGARTIELLLHKKYNVVGIDNINDYYDVRLKKYRLRQLQSSEYSSQFQFAKIDIENKLSLERLFKKHQFSAIINLAARAGVRYSVINPHVYTTTNVLANLNLLDLAKNYEVKKYVMASTSSLYAGSKMPFKEDLPVNTPISPYAASKKAAELMAYTYHYLHGLDVSVLRYFTVYGPACRPDMSILRFIKWIEEGAQVQLLGDGSQKRDFTYIDDIANGTIKALKKVKFEIINLGHSRPYSLNDMIRIIEKETGKKARIKRQPMPKTDIDHTWANIKKAQSVLKWNPKVSFPKGLQKTVQWYKDNKTFLKNLHI